MIFAMTTEGIKPGTPANPSVGMATVYAMGEDGKGLVPTGQSIEYANIFRASTAGPRMIWAMADAGRYYLASMGDD